MSKLQGRKIFVVEDEPIVSMSLEDILEDLGCIIVGPAAQLAAGIAIAESAEIDAAILDINLAGERSDRIAEILCDRGIPFAFASGYDTAPGRFQVAMIAKPYRAADIRKALLDLLG